MRYMLLMYRNEKVWGAMPVQDRVAIYEQAVEYSEGLRKRGVYLAGDPLELTGTAVTVRMRDGKAFMTDGPFVETKEQLGGYNIVDVKNRDEAMSIAAGNPLLRGGHTIEVRAIREGPPR